MPELRFTLRWPDGTQETYYSPSTVVRDHFVVGRAYPIVEFVPRCRRALTAASERVRAVHGYPCPRSLGQLARIEATAAHYPADATVLFQSFQGQRHASC